MSITLMHDFHTKTSSVEDVSPGVDHLAVGCQDRLIEIKTIQVEGHSRYAQSCKPDTNDWPCSKEEVKASANY